MEQKALEVGCKKKDVASAHHCTALCDYIPRHSCFRFELRPRQAPRMNEGSKYNVEVWQHSAEANRLYYAWIFLDRFGGS
jgi:hypothetical protein